ncbi:MAG: methyltransferase domain-containing protein [Rhodospirillaceae bacterium]|nr:methyltransferase domain-containing protein [Rhodospirillaceae bacterium]
MPDSMLVFDRALVRRHRDRAAPGFSAADFLFRESAARLADRLLDMAREFALTLDLGCRTGLMTEALRGHPKIGRIVQCDPSPAMARQAGLYAPTVCADEEWLPFAEGAFDLALSNLSLQWVNDLPGALAQTRRAIKPDGLLLATMFGGETLQELRIALLEAESELTGGITPRVSPFVDMREAGGLLTRAGFALPVVDTETITVTYGDMFKLMADLRAMGETNAVIERAKKPSGRALFLRAAEIYRDRFSDARGRLTATFQVVTLTAWVPHASQQKPLRPGSAKARLADALATREIGLGEKP